MITLVIIEEIHGIKEIELENKWFIMIARGTMTL